jgi:hypothetical protein
MSFIMTVSHGTLKMTVAALASSVIIQMMFSESTSSYIALLLHTQIAVVSALVSHSLCDEHNMTHNAAHNSMRKKNANLTKPVCVPHYLLNHHYTKRYEEKYNNKLYSIT